MLSGMLALLKIGGQFLSIQAQDFIEESRSSTKQTRYSKEFLSIQAQDFIEDTQIARLLGIPANS